MVVPFRVDLTEIARITSDFVGNLPFLCNSGKVDPLARDERRGRGMWATYSADPLKRPDSKE
jgi:hypothetical protein